MYPFRLPRGPTWLLLLLLTIILFLAVLAVTPARATLPSGLPSLSEIQTAIQDSSAGWTAGTNTMWNLGFSEAVKRLGCKSDSKGSAAGSRFEMRRFEPLPDSLDWTNNNGNHVSSVKNQQACGSCWAHAACGVLESMREIKGLTNSGTFDDLSEQFIVSCDTADSGCGGGWGDKVANFLRDTGTVDETCFPYVASDTACANRCSDWSSRLRQITSWSYTRDGSIPSDPGAIDTLRTALQSGPLWVTMRVMADFEAYNKGVYRHVIGPWLGNHAILLVGYNDATHAFKCKNSWGNGWGESGYFRIAYSQVYSGVRFARVAIAYSLSSGGGGGWDDFSYGVRGVGMHWRPGTMPIVQLADDKIIHLTAPFPFKYYGRFDPNMDISTNGWARFGSSLRDENSWPDHYPIPDPLGPSAMLAPLWTDLDPTLGGEMLTDLTSDGQYVVEYRNVMNKTTHTPETFEIILLDPARYPTFTGEGRIQFQYQQHTPGADYLTAGIERWSQISGYQLCYNGAGMPIVPGMALEFYPIPHGDEAAPRPPESFTAAYSEPFADLSWRNPTQNVNAFDLLFLTDIEIFRDGVMIGEMRGSPGQSMTFADRGPDPGSHVYAVKACVGGLGSDPATQTIQIPGRRDLADHNVGNATFTVTDQGICGFLSGGGEGRGFIYPRGGSNSLYIGGLWAATDSVYALNRDYLADTHTDWMLRNDVEGPGHAVSDQDYRAIYDDAGSAYARGLRVEQDSWAWASSPYDDFVILRYTLTNVSSEPITPLYVGQFMDWDLSNDSANNQGATDRNLRMAYMWSGTGQPYVGVALMDTIPDNPPLRNLTMIHNRTFVWPNERLLDSDRYLFLAGGDSAHSVARSWTQDDWSALVSAGPYELEPGDSVRVAFAVIAGSDLADLSMNAALAYQKYALNPAGVADRGWNEDRLVLHVNRPNPFRASTTIRYSLPTRARVDLAIYEASGRLVRAIVRGTQGPGTYTAVWDGRDPSGRPLPSGIYFCRLRTGGASDTRSMVLIR